MEKEKTSKSRTGGRPRIENPGQKKISKSVTLATSTWARIDEAVRKELAFEREPAFTNMSRYIELVVLKDLQKRGIDDIGQITNQPNPITIKNKKDNLIDPNLMREQALRSMQQQGESTEPEIDDNFFEDGFFD